jgi:hypothetical protein
MLRYSEILVLVLTIALVAWLNLPKLLAPAFVLTIILFSVDRRRRGIWPWPSHDSSNGAISNQRPNYDLHAAFTCTAASGLCAVAGVMGYELSKRSRFFTGTAWSDDVIWWQVWVGVAFALVAVYFWRKGLRTLPASS